MQKRVVIVGLIVVLALLVTCLVMLYQQPRPAKFTGNVTSKPAPVCNVTWPQVEVKYAKLFKIVHTDSYYLIVRDAENQTVVLVPRGCPKPNVSGIIIYVPVRKVVYFSTTEVALLYRLATELNNLSLLRTIVGVTWQSKWWIPHINEMLRNGTIKFVGTTRNPNFELILKLEPDVVVMYTGIAAMEQIKQKLTSLRLKVVIDNEWLEDSYLARFEWIKFIAAFYGPKALAVADKIFRNLERVYNEAIREADKLKKVKFAWFTTWAGKIYVPRVDSYVVKTLEALSGEYVFKTLKLEGTGSAVVSPEFVNSRLPQAEVVMIASYPPWKSALDDIPEVVDIASAPAVAGHRTFAFHPSYWQLGYAYTDKVLLDLLSILHPEFTYGRHYVRTFFIPLWYRDRTVLIGDVKVTWHGFYKTLSNRYTHIALVPWGMTYLLKNVTIPAVEVPATILYTSKCESLVKIVRAEWAGVKCENASECVALVRRFANRTVVIVDVSELGKFKPYLNVIPILALDCSNEDNARLIFLLLGYDDLAFR